MVSLSLNFPYERQIFNLLNQLSIISVISTLQPSLNCISVIKESPYLKFSCESNSIDLSSVFPLSRRIQSNLFNSLYDRCYISTISNLHVLYGKISSISISYQLDIWKCIFIECCYKQLKFFDPLVSVTSITNTGSSCGCISSSCSLWCLCSQNRS